jgi:hypothetical protein
MDSQETLRDPRGKRRRNCGGRTSDIQLWIPIQGGQAFRFDPGHDSDLMAATVPI